MHLALAIRLPASYSQSTFNPLTLSPALWLDASDAASLFDAPSGGAAVVANGAVARWQDKSGNNFHATQATLASRPLLKVATLNTMPTVRFDGVDDGMIHPLSVVGDHTVFMVARSFETTPAERVIFSAAAPNAAFNCCLWEGTAVPDQWGTFRSAGIRQSGYTLRGGYKIISMVAVGFGGSFNSNGTTTPFSESGFYSDAADRRGIAFNGVSGGRINCDIAEILVFQTALSAINHAAVVSYLNSKWAVF